MSGSNGQREEIVVSETFDKNAIVLLSSDWYQYRVVPGVNEAIPGIYEWHIEGMGSYIGQYKSIKRPTKQYRRNVVRLLAGKDYRTGNKRGFRRVHCALALAHRKGWRITLTILENVPSPVARSERERALGPVRIL